MRRFTVVVEQDEDGYYVASVPSLASCYTQARTLEELAPRMKFIAFEQVEVAV
jgi:predicted RNase H-like HicB family nuclease